MKTMFGKACLAVLVAGLLSAGTAVAQDRQRAATLDELLEMVRQNRILETEEHREREAEFRRNRANQEQLLNQARQTRDAEERRSERLERTFDEQARQIDALRAQRNERLGSLRELFGHMTSTAGDLRTNLNRSIVSAQHPNRGDFLTELIDKMNSETRLPRIDEIERLWSEMQTEIVEGGRVVKFTGEVVKPDGNRVEQEIVRIGAFNLVSDGRYLRYEPATGAIMELERQPSGAVRRSASNLQGASSGLVRVGLDPTGPQGGTLLSRLIDRPNLIEQWHQGRAVGYVITAVGLVGLLLGFWRIFVLGGVNARVSRQLKAKKANANNPLGRVLKVAEENPGVDVETLELKLEEAVLKERPAIESGLATLKIIAAVAPLMGLLGTVTGMILTFQAITIFGAGDPRTMADGISSALVTTVLGLLVAIPTVLMHTWVNGKAKRVLHVLEEQAAGIIAENAERK